MPEPSRTPADVPMLRRELHTYASDGRMLAMYYAACAAGAQPIRPGRSDMADARTLTDAERQRLAEAELYFVDHDLSDLLDSAYPTMPEFAPREHDLPSPYGFVVFARPLATYPSSMTLPSTGDSLMDDAQQRIVDSGTRIVGASWGPFDAGGKWEAGGAWFTFWSESNTRGSDGNPHLEAAARLLPPLLVDNEGAVAWTPEGMDDDERYRLMPRDTTVGWARMLMCCFQLAKQDNLAETTVERTARPERRRTEKEQLPARDVRIVRLRRHLREQRDSGGSGREYQHRWVVRGHWRNAWYPSRNEHRPKWIAPYLKGPEGAPLIGGERVTVL